MEPFDVIALIARPEMFPYARFDIAGTENIPRSGGAIVASNHRSYFDVAAIGLMSVKAGRPMRFMAKKEVCDAPVVGSLARAMGAIRVERGSGSDRPLEEARRVLEAGDLVEIFPQGTIPRGEEFFEPVLKGRPGVARLSKMTGAAVVPVGIWGTEQVWPRNSRVPRLTRVFDPPTVTVRVGAPIESGHLSDDTDEATVQIMNAITELLPPEARTRRVPTEQEIALAMPPGKSKVKKEERDGHG
jgi:putative phosphoserine phosphatase/1-acylglycerol-3-phosphate O-acyltransferase